MRQVIPIVPVVLASLVILTACPQDDPDRAADRPADRDAPAADRAPATADVPDIDEGALPEGVTLTMVQEGAQLYQGSVCVACHGAQGVGTALGPALNDPDWINISHDYDEIVHIIEVGVPSPQEYQSPMPRMGGAHFNQEQLRALGAYVYALAEAGG